MTAGEVLERARGWAERARPWLPYVAVVVLALVIVRGCNRQHEAEAETARLREAERLRAAGQVVAQQVPNLGPRVAALEGENGELRAELERARAAAPGAKPVGVVTARTAAAPVIAPARPADPPQAAVPACVLANGDGLRLDVDEVLLQTKGGNRVLVGTAAAWRTSPGEPALLLRQPFSAPLTEAAGTPPPANALARWRAGPLAVLGTEGWRLGALLATPQARVPLIGWQVEAQLGGAVGPGGGQAQAAVLFQP